MKRKSKSNRRNKTKRRYNRRNKTKRRSNRRNKTKRRSNRRKSRIKSMKGGGKSTNTQQSRQKFENDRYIHKKEIRRGANVLLKEDIPLQITGYRRKITHPVGINSPDKGLHKQTPRNI
jgi:hypothetical protein